MTTEQSIIENNKLIAEFMGYWLADEGFYFNNEMEQAFAFDSEIFKKSFDWLMPIVEKIETTKSKNGFYYDVDILTTGVMISDVNNHIVQVTQEEIQSTSKIEAVYYACVTFIKWHNSQLTTLKIKELKESVNTLTFKGLGMGTF